MKRLLLCLIGSILPLVGACAAPLDELGEDETAVSSEAAITGTLRANAELVTTTRVNLRQGPSTTRDVLDVLPTGTSVTVLTGQPTAGFYEVSANGQRGWVYGVYLRPSDDGGADDVDEQTEGTAGGSCFDSQAAARMVAIARRMDGRSSQHLCYRYVKNHIEGAGVMSRSEIPAEYQASAYQFATWARHDPAGFARAGFKRSSADLASIPPGAVLVWRPGQCGYSSQHGHIEIAIGGGRACSDFCGTIKRGCGMPEVFVPIGSACP